jgi:hypothetical protein
MAKQIQIPTDRAMEQEPPIGIEIITPKQDRPMQYGRRYRETWPLPASHIVDIGLI